ncbi:hypothetical protein F5884DRAFT_39692 [Xylogone sp. PMI_703]|nr:hypothetical protein F5884DRAFT_39692 [Xylogone sp. PMI_703]
MKLQKKSNWRIQLAPALVTYIITLTTPQASGALLEGPYKIFGEAFKQPPVRKAMRSRTGHNAVFLWRESGKSQAVIFFATDVVPCPGRVSQSGPCPSYVEWEKHLFSQALEVNLGGRAWFPAISESFQHPAGETLTGWTALGPVQTPHRIPRGAAVGWLNCCLVSVISLEIAAGRWRARRVAYVKEATAPFAHKRWLQSRTVAAGKRRDPSSTARHMSATERRAKGSPRAQREQDEAGLRWEIGPG